MAQPSSKCPLHTANSILSKVMWSLQAVSTSHRLLEVTHHHCVQLNRWVYSLFSLTQRSYTAKVTSLGLFTGPRHVYLQEQAK
jgi:hypothetical protein